MFLIYTRRSTSDENHQQYSLDAQEKICRRYAEQRGLRFAEIIREEHSAKLAGKRPMFLKMLKDLEEKKYAGIVVHNVDRLLRSIGDYALIDRLRMQGTEFHFVDGSYPNTPEGNMMLGINVVFAKWYVEKLCKEVKKGFRESLEQGRLPREAPVGYLDKGKGIKEPDPVSAPLVRQAFQLYATGDHSVETLTYEMRKRGLLTKRGQKYRKCLSTSSMHRILSNGFYCGVVTHVGETFQGKHQPLIPRSLFDVVQKRLNSNCTSIVTKKPFAYRGMLRCVCGHMLSPYEKKGHAYYGCHNKVCPEKTTREEAVEEGIMAVLRRISFTDKELEQTRDAMKRLEQFVSDERDALAQSIEKRRAKLLQEFDRARQLVIDNVFGKEEYEAEKQRLQSALSALNEEEQKLQHMEVQRLEDVYRFLELSRNAPVYYKNGTASEKRHIAQLVFLELKVKSKNLASYSLSEAFAPLEKRGVIPCGGADGI